MNPVSELRKAVTADLKALSPTIAVYDRVQLPTAKPSFPYASWGPSQSISDDADCIDGAELSLQIDVWSREPGYLEVEALSDRIKRRLHRKDYGLPVNALASLAVETIRYMRDADGVTSHAVITLAASIEEH